MVKRGKGWSCVLKRRGDRFDLRFFDVAEKLDRQMKIRRRNPSNGGNALSKIVDGPANFLDDLRLQIDGEKGANHDYSKRVSRSQLSAACEVPRMMRSRSPWNWN